MPALEGSLLVREAVMDYRFGLLLCAILFCAAGCQNTKASLTALENENRRLEDRVYLLEDELNQHCDQVDRLDQENQLLRMQVASTVSSVKTNLPDGKPVKAPNGAGQNGSTGNGFTPPKIDLGEPTAPSGVNGQNGDSDELPGPAPPFDGPAPKLPRLMPSPGAFASPVSHASDSVEDLLAASTDVMRITLDRLQSKHFTHVSQQAFVVIVEPRNASGKIVPAVGNISLVVIDMQRQGDAARLARWDFSADQAAACIRGTVLGKRMYFHLDWPEAPIENQNLRLYVRMHTADGRFVQANAPLELESVRSILREWTKEQVTQLPAQDNSNTSSVATILDAKSAETPELAQEPLDDDLAVAQNSDACPGEADKALSNVDDELAKSDSATHRLSDDELASDGRLDSTEENRQMGRPRSNSSRRSPRTAARRRPVWAPYR